MNNEATVLVRDERLLGPVLGRVVGMLAARANFPVDRLDDALLLTDAIAAHGPDHDVNGTVALTVRVDDEGMALEVGPLRDGGAQAMLRAAELPQVGNVFERIADAVSTDDERLLVRVALR